MNLIFKDPVSVVSGVGLSSIYTTSSLDFYCLNCVEKYEVNIYIYILAKLIKGHYFQFFVRNININNNVNVKPFIILHL